MDETFGTRLRDRVRALGPLCVGIDPSRELLESWDRDDTVEGMEFFTRAALEAVVGTATAIKPQVAFFERFGSAGYRVLEQLIGDARDADVLVVADAKRGDFAGHQPRVRRGVVGRTIAASRGRRHGESLSRRRRVGAAVRARRGERPGGLCPRGDVEPRGPRHCSGRARPRASGWRTWSFVRSPNGTGATTDSGPSAPSSAPRATLPNSIWRIWAVRSWCPVSARRAVARRTSRDSSRVVRRTPCL